MGMARLSQPAATLHACSGAPSFAPSAKGGELLREVSPRAPRQNAFWRHSSCWHSLGSFDSAQDDKGGWSCVHVHCRCGSDTLVDKVLSSTNNHGSSLPNFGPPASQR